MNANEPECLGAVESLLERHGFLTIEEWESRASLTLVLVGLPDLDGRLALRRNRWLDSRIHHPFGIAPRSQLVGLEREPFTSDAIAMPHEAARGVLRKLDRFAITAIRDAGRRERNFVDWDAILWVAATLHAPLSCLRDRRP